MLLSVEKAHRRKQKVGKIEKEILCFSENPALLFSYKSFEGHLQLTRIGKILNPDGLEKAAGS